MSKDSPGYASGQSAIYLTAGVAALLGGLLVLALVRPERPSPAAPAPGAAEPSDAGVRAAS